ncbi:MAG: BACON domain-containing carbohydrate-binding protein, partial [Bacteroidota bacterium]
LIVTVPDRLTLVSFSSIVMVSCASPAPDKRLVDIQLSLLITIDENDTSVNRSGTVTISGGTESVTITVFQDPGEPVSVLENFESEILLFPNPTPGRVNLSNLPSGLYSSHVEVVDLAGRSLFAKAYPIDNSELVLDLDALVPGTYLLHMKFRRQNGTVYTELTRKIVRD